MQQVRRLRRPSAVIEIVYYDVDEFETVVDALRSMIRRRELPVCSSARCAHYPPPNSCMLPLTCTACDTPAHAPRASHTSMHPPRRRQSCAPAPSPPPAPPLCSSELRSADRRLGLLLTQAPPFCTQVLAAWHTVDSVWTRVDSAAKPCTEISFSISRCRCAAQTHRVFVS